MVQLFYISNFLGGRFWVFNILVPRKITFPTLSICVVFCKPGNVYLCSFFSFLVPCHYNLFCATVTMTLGIRCGWNNWQDKWCFILCVNKGISVFKSYRSNLSFPSILLYTVWAITEKEKVINIFEHLFWVSKPLARLYSALVRLFLKWWNYKNSYYSHILLNDGLKQVIV